MTVNTGDDITAAQYEELRGKAARVLGQPSGSWSTGSIGTTAGYNQNPDAPIRLPNDVITAVDWNKLHSDLSRSYFHIVGSEPSIDEVAVGEAITAANYNAYDDIADFNLTNRNTVAITQRSLSSATTGSLTDTWTGIQRHAFTMQWDDQDHKEGWINSGGTLRFTASAVYSGSDSKSNDWKTIVNGAGVTELNNMSMTNTGAGELLIAQAGPTYNGWWYLDAQPNNTAITIYSTDGSDHAGYSEYDNNAYRIKFIKRSNTTYEFRVEVNDIEGGGNVATDITSTVQVFTATGANVALSVPTFAEATPSNTFNFT